MKPTVRSLAALFLELSLSGCGESSHSLPTMVPITHSVAPIPTTQKVPASIKIIVPSGKSTTTNAKRRKSLSIAYNSAGLLINAYAPGTTTPVLTTVAANVSSGSPLCITQSDTSRICSIPMTLPIGSYDFTAANYDKLPASSTTITTGANELGFGKASGKTLISGSANIISFSIASVLASASLTIPATIIPPLSNYSQQITVSGLDLDGNIIMTDPNSDGYINSLGSPASITLSATAYGSSTSLVSFSSSTISAPSATGVTLTYNAANLVNAIPGINVSLTALPSTGGSSGSATLNIIGATGLGNIYVSNPGTSTVTKYNAAGTQQTFTTTGMGLRIITSGLTKVLLTK